MRSSITTLFAATLLASGVEAANKIAMHERVEAKPHGLKVKGKAKAAKITATLRPGTSHAGYGVVSIGLGSMDAAKAGVSRSEKRAAARDPKQGYLRVKLDELTGVSKPRKVEFIVDYAEHGLKPGEQLDFVTAWGKSASDLPGTWHVFGMFHGPVESGDQASVITLP